MKTKMTWALVALLASWTTLGTSFGSTGNEGAAGAPGPLQWTIASITDTGGALPPQYRVQRVITINNGGEIVLTTRSGMPPVAHTQKLAQLSSEETSRLADEAIKMQYLELSHAMPPGSSPICPGAPVITTRVGKPGQRPFEIERDLGCDNIYYRPDQKGGDMIRLLRAFLTLTKTRLPNGRPVAVIGGVLARQQIVGGFVPAHVPVHRELRISAEGMVSWIQKWRDGREETHELLQFEPRVLADLNLLAQTVPNVEIVMPNKPPCYDAPSELQAVYSDGKLVPIWKRVACNSGALQPTPGVQFYSAFLDLLFDSRSN